MSLENTIGSILLVEDEQEIADIIMLHLSDLGYSVTHASDGMSGLTLALKQSWDLMLLDLTLPRIDGIDICRQVRDTNPALPIIVVSARNAEDDRIIGFDTGADDYITKPFGIDELIARVKAALRRVEAMKSIASTDVDVVSVNGVVLDPVQRTVSISGKAVKLTAKEFELLMYFAKAPGHVFNRGELLEKVWGYGHHGYLHTVNTHINRLRNKIETDPANPVYIQTVWGVGYKLAK